MPLTEKQYFNKGELYQSSSFLNLTLKTTAAWQSEKSEGHFKFSLKGVVGSRNWLSCNELILMKNAFCWLPYEWLALQK